MTSSITMRRPDAVETLDRMRSRRLPLREQVAGNWQGWLGSLTLHGAFWMIVATLGAAVAVERTECPFLPDLRDSGIWQPLTTFDQVDALFSEGNSSGADGAAAKLSSLDTGGDRPSVGYEDMASGAPDWSACGGQLDPLGATGDAGDRLAGKSFLGGDAILAALTEVATADEDTDWISTGGSLSGFGYSSDGGCTLRLGGWGSPGPEVVFCIDASGSMGDCFYDVKTRVRGLIRVVRYVAPNARVGIVAYRDLKANDKEGYEWLAKYMPLQASNADGLAKLERFLKELDASGGGDLAEAVDIGLRTCIEKAGWGRNTKKIIVLFGDAPPHVEKDGLAESCELCRRFNAAGGTVACVDTRGESTVMDEFKKMALAGGGEATLLVDDRAIVKQILVTFFGPQWASYIDRPGCVIPKQAQ